MTKPSAILVSDIELRLHPPMCRTDNHFDAQKKKLIWLSNLQKKYNCPIFDAGDLFDKRYKTHPSHELLSFAIEHLPNKFYTIPGNHDLPGNSIEKYNNSAMNVLEESGILQVPYKNPIKISKNVLLIGFPWEVPIENIEPNNKRTVAIVHTMVYDKNQPWPDCEGYKALDLLKKLSHIDLIITGHHHKTFVRKYRNRLLVNPGSFMRNDADQINHKPSVFLWYSEENIVRRMYVPIEDNVITKEHIENKIQQEKRLDAFVKLLGTSEKLGVNFFTNLRRACEKKNIHELIKKKVWEYYGE